MRRRIPLGRILGVRLFLHPSWFLVFGLVTWATSTTFGDVYPGLASAERLSMGLATGLAFFACLAAHELAHSVVARRFGVRIRGITLFAFGGMAEIDGELPTPARELAVASAGPATSIAIGGLFGLASAGAASIGWGAGQGVCTTLAVVNLGVAAFNLVPGLPLDGGRLLRAGIWRLTGSHRVATRIASASGVVVAVALAALGLALALTGDLVGLWYVPMATFLWLLARVSSHPGTPSTPAPGALGLVDDEGEASKPGP